MGGRLPEIARSRLEFPSREKMMGWALTRWRALTWYSMVTFLPVHTSEQGNVIGLVSVYMSSKKIVIERTRDPIYLKFVVTDFSPKIISPSAGENSGDSS